MRDPARLDRFYITMCGLHKQYCPDMRFGQLMYNFLSVYGDPFFWEEDKFINSFEEFIKMIRVKKSDEN